MPTPSTASKPHVKSLTKIAKDRLKEAASFNDVGVCAMIAQDAADLFSLAELVSEGKFRKAMRMAERLDTDVRELIPYGVWVYMSSRVKPNSR